MSTATISDPRVEQRASALQQANKVRCENAEKYREIKQMPRAAGCSAVAEILVGADDVRDAMRLGQLLKTPRRIGVANVSRLLNKAEIRSADRQLRQVTSRQRHVLATGLLAMSAPIDGKGGYA